MTTRFESIPDTRPHDEPWPAMVWPVDPEVRLCGQLVELSLVELARDGAALFAALDDDSVWTHMARRPEGVQEYVEQLGRALAMGVLPWVVRLRRSLRGLGRERRGDVVVPRCVRPRRPPRGRLDGLHARGVGERGQSETKLLLLEHAFDVLGAGRVQLKTDVRNVRSHRPSRGSARSTRGPCGATSAAPTAPCVTP